MFKVSVDTMYFIVGGCGEASMWDNRNFVDERLEVSPN